MNKTWLLLLSGVLSNIVWIFFVFSRKNYVPVQHAKPGPIANKTAVALCVAGLVREFDGPVLPDMFEHHVLRPLAKDYRLYITFAVDREPQRGLRRAVKYGNVSVRIQNASNIAQRHAACLEELRRLSSTHSVSWVLVTRPDMAYFEDPPNLALLMPGIHMRARVWKSSTNLTVFQSFVSYHWWLYVANNSPSRSISCDAALNTTMAGDCITFDDQLAIMDASNAEAYLGTHTHKTSSNSQKCRACSADIEGGYGAITGSAEYILSQKLIAAGVPLHLLSWTTRLGRYVCQLEGKHNVLSEIV
jgi:hypothetical protein